jgi:hypothetical protein
VKVLKGPGNYLRRKAMQNLALTVLCVIVFVIIFLSDIPRSPLYIDVGRYEGPRVLLLFFPFFFTFYFFRKFSGWKQGYDGEKRVGRVLSSNLSDEYSLINDVTLSDGYGNIDHVVLGPNGVFVIETKNYGGKIICNGDQWSSQYESKKKGRFNRLIYFELGSPSKQVTRNSMRIKRLIESLETLDVQRIWVEGIVVFANQHADLDISNPTVPILKVEELPDFIVTRKSNIQFTTHEIELMGKEILRQM